jgi:hypothetical protein
MEVMVVEVIVMVVEVMVMVAEVMVMVAEVMVAEVMVMVAEDTAVEYLNIMDMGMVDMVKTTMDGGGIDIIPSQ